MDASQEGATLDFSAFTPFKDEDNLRLFNRKVEYIYYREMDKMEFLHRGLEIVADDSTQMNNDGNVIKIYSNDEAIKDVLENLFLERLDMNNELWSIFYETCKMGDNFYEVIPDNYENPKKIVFIRYLDPEKIERIEKNGRLSHFEYRSDEKDRYTRRKNPNLNDSEEMVKLQPWQIIDFKIEDKETDPYGGSLFKSGVKTFRRLSLLEDIILVYRISRAPERRVFYIDVGNMNYVDAKKFMKKIKAQYRTQNFIDENGNINKRSNVLSITSDIFVPRREGGKGTEISTLAGGEALKTIDDLDYFKDKILRTMNIPAAYLGDDTDRSRGSLCLHPNTKIKLADGRNLSIKKLTDEFEKGIQNYVYSVNEKTLEWEINKIIWAGKTRENAELVEVTVDNGKSVKCTPDHKFMLRDGTYCEAKDLKEGTSLMPIYTKLSSKENGDKIDGYEMLLSNKTNKWEYTHRVALEEELLNEKNKDIPSQEKKTTCHHIDYKKENNNPTNLVLMTSKSHWELHQRLGENLSSEKVIKKRNESIKEFYSTEEGKKIGRENALRAVNSENRKEWLGSKEHKKIKSEQMKKQWENGGFVLTEEKRKKLSESAKKRWQDPEYREWMKEQASKGGKKSGKKRSIEMKEKWKDPEYREWMKEQASKGGKKSGKKRSTEMKEKWKDPEYREWMKEQASKGGSIKSKNNPNYRNLEMAEIIRNYKKDILQKDLIKKLNISRSSFYAALKRFGFKNWSDFKKNGPNHKVVSVKYLEETIDTYDITVDKTHNFAIESGVVIKNSQQDIKFGRFIERIQAQIQKGMNKLAALELFFNGQKKEDLNNFRIEFTPPSNIKEITEIDLINQRMGLISTIQATQLYSNEWILRNIMKHSEKEISDIMLNKSMEARQAGAGAEGGMAGGFGPEAGGLPGGEMGGPIPGGEALPGGELGAPPPEIGVPGGIAAATIINILGKEFLLENKNDFFKLIKATEDYNERQRNATLSPLFEIVSNMMKTPIKNPVNNRTKNLKHQMIINEFGGLKMTGKRSMLLFENVDGDFIEREIFLEE